MEIIVLAKVVDFIYAQTGTDISRNYVGPDDTVQIVNPLDESGLEFALQIKDRFPMTAVTVICLGGSRVQQLLKRCLAMGADHVCHIDSSDPREMDAWMRACVLAALLRKKTYDLIVAGRQSLDENQGLTASYLAERLNLPQISGVVELETISDDRKMLIHRLLERGDREILRCSLPAVLTVDKGAGEPRYPTLPGSLRAERHPIETIPLEQLGIPGEDFGSEGPLVWVKSVTNPKPKKKKAPPETVKRSAAARLSFLMKPKGNQKKKTSGLIAGESVEAVSRIQEILRDNGIVINPGEVNEEKTGREAYGEK